MNTLFDPYSFQARVLPVYLTLIPIVLMLAAIVPDGFKWSIGGSAAFVSIPISFLLGQLGADFGKRLESKLWQSWGGPPTTRFLRHGNSEFNENTRLRVHGNLRALGLHVPTKEEQEQNCQVADSYYESCTEELIRRTRDKSKFPLVFKGLVDYGFRRNLLGLKPIGVLLTIISLVVIACSFCYVWLKTNEPPATLIVTGFITVGLLYVWLTWVTERTVKIAANRYARYLLESALEKE